MPVIHIPKKILWRELKLPDTFTREHFEELCFQFGIELDEVVTEAELSKKSTAPGEKKVSTSNEEIYKIEIPANRYDLLCIEGLCRALNIFRGTIELPTYKIKNPTSNNTNSLQVMIAEPSVASVRSVLVGAVLRNIKFDAVSYASFIDLQEKLHQNLCRKRTLVSIGTHDLDTIKGPFVYQALPPKQIKFVPLNETKQFDGEELMKHFDQEQSHLKKYLHIIRDSPTYPVIKDSNGVVLSLPPIINGDHSKITMNTRNVLIEITATDKTKALVVLDTICAMFSQHIVDQPFTVEQVKIIIQTKQGNNNAVEKKEELTPDWITPRYCSSTISYINECVGLNLSPEQIVSLFKKMSLGPAKLSADKLNVEVQVPPTRSDILHACDLMEDIAISYGFNNLTRKLPETNTPGKQLPINKLTDQLRLDIAMHGYSEVLTLALCSRDETFTFLNQKDDGSAVTIGNPKTAEFQVCRTNLLVGVLKSIQANKAAPLPIKIFEIADIILKSNTSDTGAINKRVLCAAYSNKTSGFEKLHGLMDRVMMALDVKPCNPNEKTGYYILPSNDETYFPGRRADVFYKGNKVGTFGVVHPTVLEKFELVYPVCALHLEIEPFL